MTSTMAFLRNMRIRHVLFGFLFLSGIIPLATISFFLAQQSREILETEEKTYLTRSAQALTQQISDDIEGISRLVSQSGRAFVLVDGPDNVADRFREPWAEEYLTQFFLANSGQILSLRTLDLTGNGPWLGASEISEDLRTTLNVGFNQALDRQETVLRFVPQEDTHTPLMVLSTPIFSSIESAETPRVPKMIMQVVLQLNLLQRIFLREAQGKVAIFLIDQSNQVLWSEGASPAMRDSLVGSELMADFQRRPLTLTVEYQSKDDGGTIPVVARVSPVKGTPWGIVVQKPVAASYEAAKRMLWATGLSSALLLLLSFATAVLVAGRFSAPIQRFAESSRRIAEGNFGERVQVRGLGREVYELADHFNSMGENIEGYVDELQKSAELNRTLFVGSIRAFAAAVDAKDPYTRGHSERVAKYSRFLAGYLGLKEEFQETIWIAALLHDVGKIGVEDQVLKKSGGLTPEEFDEMKRHPGIGAEILSPIEALREMLPAVRWHHEAWNGQGYPDGLKGEEIPLMARIVCVADTFDAITTTRPYQPAHTMEFAVETITRLTGSRFDAKIVTAFLRAVEDGAIMPEGTTPSEDYPEESHDDLQPQEQN